MRKILAVDGNTGWEELVYLAEDGEFIRERWAVNQHHDRFGNAPGAVVRAIFPDNNRPGWLVPDLTPGDITEEMKAEAATVQIVNRVYVPNKFASPDRITNWDIRMELWKNGLTEARQFPEVAFYVDELRGTRAAGVETRASMMGWRQNERVCLLTTTGDRSDLDEFLSKLSNEYNRGRISGTFRFDKAHVIDHPVCPRAPLTERMREIALRLGAFATTSKETEQRVNREMAQDRKAAELRANAAQAIEQERRTRQAIARLEAMAKENQGRVAEWPDAAGEGRDLTQEDPARQPTLRVVDGGGVDVTPCPDCGLPDCPQDSEEE